MIGTNLVLILARDLASNLATPVFVVNAEGTLVFYNEPAELILGRTFAEVGPLSQSEWGTLWSPTDESGVEIPVNDLPLSEALSRRKPSHRKLCISRPDGSLTAIEITAIPLFAGANEFVGALAIFWKDPTAR